MAITKTLNWEQVGIYLESSRKRKEFGVTEVGRQGKGERRGMGGGVIKVLRDHSEDSGFYSEQVKKLLVGFE